MTHRIIESDNGLFYPQTRRGRFRRWRLFCSDADTSPFMLEALVLTDDPAKAAAFATALEAKDFILRVGCKAADYWEEKERAVARQRRGVKIKHVVG